MSMSFENTIAKMPAPQLLSFVRARDLAVIKTLVRTGVKGTETQKPVWTVGEVHELLLAQGIEVDKSTVSKWAK